MIDQTVYLLLITGLAILLLLIFVIKLKIHAFVSLLLVSVFVALGAGMDFQMVVASIEKGMGDILGFIAVIVGLGAILGKLLEASGGAETLANYLIKGFGEKRSNWALAFTGFVISIPVFLDVGFIILVPIVYALTRRSNKSLLHYAIPLLAGLAVTHAFIPPTPGPVAVAEVMGLDLGWMIIFGMITGIPTAIIAGPLFGKYIGSKIHVKVPAYLDTEQARPPGTRKDFVLVAVIILLPLLLILISTTLSTLIKTGAVSEGLFVVELFLFLGHPFIALIIATLAALYFLGIRKGFSGKKLLSFSDEALAPAGLIILVTGAGGVFKQILIESGVGEALAGTLLAYNIAPIILAYILAVVVRVTQGSATVAMITSAGMVAPILEITGPSEPHKALIAIAIAAGSTILSHVNDSGFWLVNKYLGLTEKQTLQSWTVMETIISVSGFCFALLLSFFI